MRNGKERRKVFKRITELENEGKSGEEIAAALTAEGVMGKTWTRALVAGFKTRYKKAGGRIPRVMRETPPPAAATRAIADDWLAMASLVLDSHLPLERKRRMLAALSQD